MDSPLVLYKYILPHCHPPPLPCPHPKKKSPASHRSAQFALWVAAFSTVWIFDEQYRSLKSKWHAFVWAQIEGLKNLNVAGSLSSKDAARTRLLQAFGQGVVVGSFREEKSIAGAPQTGESNSGLVAIGDCGVHNGMSVSFVAYLVRLGHVMNGKTSWFSWALNPSFDNLVFFGSCFWNMLDLSLWSGPGLMLLIQKKHHSGMQI